MTQTYSASIKYVNLSRTTAIKLIGEYTFHFGFNSLRACRRLHYSNVDDAEHMRDYELAEAIVTAAEVLSNPSLEHANEYSVFYMIGEFEDKICSLNHPFHVDVGKASATYPRQ